MRVSGATGTSETRAELPNPKGVLRPGQFVRVTLKGAMRPNAITVPQRAVLEGPQGKFVYVLGAESKAEPRPVQVGEWAGDDWIIQSGLKAGDKVIVDGVARIFAPGAPVQVGRAEERRSRKKRQEMISRFFIDRPIFAAVLSIFIVIAGLASMRIAADRAVPGDRAAGGDRARDLSRAPRPRCWSRRWPRRSRTRSPASRR